MTHRARSRLRVLALTLVVTFSLGLALEVLLNVFDLPRPRYLVPHTPRGTWRTQFYLDNPRPREEFIVPPKGSRTRVVILGGSNARGLFFPDSETTEESFFESLINAGQAESDRFEIVNLGRHGYGSDRVRAVFEQVLDALDPDVLVILTGDNEFAECPRWSATNHRLQNRVRLRTEPWIRSLIRHAAPEPVLLGRCPDLDYTTTLHRLDLLSRNLLAMSQLAEVSGTRVVFSTLPYNRFEAPVQSSFLEERPAKLHAWARAQLSPVLGPLLRPGGSVWTKDWIFGRERGATRRQPEELPGRRSVQGELADVDPELADWLAPKVWELHSALNRLHGELLPAERQQLESARILLSQAVEMAPSHALLQFDLALVTYALDGATAKAVELFETAAYLDHAPKKANQVINGAIRRAAAASRSIELFDADRRFSSSAPDGLPGYEWFYDGCHLNIGARKAFIAWLSTAVLRRES